MDCSPGLQLAIVERLLELCALGPDRPDHRSDHRPTACCRKQALRGVHSASSLKHKDPRSHQVNTNGLRLSNARFQRLNNQYVKPVLLRPSVMKMRGPSILNVYKKLSEQDAAEYLEAHGRLKPEADSDADLTLYKYLLKSKAVSHSAGDIPSDSSQTALVDRGDGSVPLPDHTSATILDMRILDTQTNEAACHEENIDTQRILDHNMFQSRRKSVIHSRHMLPTAEPHLSPTIQHRLARLNLPHIMQPGRPTHRFTARHHTSKKHAKHNQTRGHSPAKKPRNTAKKQTGSDDNDKEGEPSKKAKEDGTGPDVETPRVVFFFSDGSEDNLDGAGSLTNTPPNEAPSEAACTPEPTAAECTLPWHRVAEQPCVPATCIYSVADDDVPQMSHVPSWVDSLDNINRCPSPLPKVCGEDVVDVAALPPPWRHVPSSSEDEEDADQPVIDKAGHDNPSFNVQDPDLLPNCFRNASKPPPWRTLGGTMHQPPIVRNDSTLVQHPSFSKLSEAESHHSQAPPHHSKVLDRVASSQDLLEEIDTHINLDVDFEQLECEDRVSNWLDVNSEHLSSLPEHCDEEEPRVETDFPDAEQADNLWLQDDDAEFRPRCDTVTKKKECAEACRSRRSTLTEELVDTNVIALHLSEPPTDSVTYL